MPVLSVTVSRWLNIWPLPKEEGPSGEGSYTVTQESKYEF